MTFKFKQKFLASAMLSTFGIAQAQNIPDAGVLLQQLERQVPSIQSLPSVGPSAPSLPAIEIKDDTKIEISDFRFKGRTLVTEDQLQKAVLKWRNQSLTLNQIRDAANAVSNEYRLNDYVAQVIIPEQEIKNGVLEFQILEVILGEISIEKSKDDDRSGFSTELAKKYLLQNSPENQYLRVDRLQRGVMILNETPGVNLSGTLEPGQKEGTSDFKTTLLDTPFITGRGEMSNFGSRSTGIPQVIGNLSLNNINGNGDIFSLTGVANQGSSYGQALYQTPIGYDGLRIGGSASYLDYQTIGEFNTNGSRGNANTYGLNIYYPWIRGAQANINVIAGYDYKSYLNLTSSPYAVISRYQLNNFYTGLSGNYFDAVLGGALTYWSINGISGNLSIGDPNQYASDSQNANTDGAFKKLTFNMNRYQNIVPNTSTLLIALSGQLADKNLSPSEQFYLGGPYGVRGYPVSQSGGAQGLIFTLEYQHKIPEDNITLISFIDTGRVQQYINTWNNWQGLTHADNFYSLYSWGFGAKWAYDKYQINSYLAFPIGNNPLYSNNGQQVNADNRQLSIQGWIQAVMYF
jgi:hemolysin activation/secretion protein